MSLLIPRVIHRIWLGGEISDQSRELERTWVRTHPEWAVRTWRDWDLPPLQNQEWFDVASTPAAKADIARYELLQRFGGVYVDTDFESLACLEPVLSSVGCFAATEDSRWVSTGIMGSIPGHPFIRRLVAGLPRSIADGLGLPPNRVSGPYYVTAQLEAYRLDHGDDDPVVVFPKELFYPYHFTEPHRRFEYFADALAVHHWSHSWVGAPRRATSSSH